MIIREYTKNEVEAWQSLAHVCRQWRSVVFGSPRRLDLQLFCGTWAQTPLGDMVDIWPTFPLLVQGNVNRPEELDNTIAVLKRSDRVRHIILRDFSSSHLEHVSSAMQEPFPELTILRLSSSEVVAAIPDSFLVGRAPRLRSLELGGIPFPCLPKLLLSITHLDTLHLEKIPHSGYFSPEAIVTALSKSTSLGFLVLEFQSPRSLPDRDNRRLPLTRVAFPFLRLLKFKGVTEYLEDLVARIDAPRLRWLEITFFNQIVFDTPHTIQFISRTALKAENAHIIFGDDAAQVSPFSSQTPEVSYGILDVKILCRELDWQVSSLEQVCTPPWPLFSTLEGLYIFERFENPDSPPNWKDNIENMLWLELLHPFTAVKNLYLSEKFASLFAPALQELVGGRTTEVLPALQNIFLEGFQPSGPIQESTAMFIAARQLSGHPISVSLWDRSRL